MNKKVAERIENYGIKSLFNWEALSLLTGIKESEFAKFSTLNDLRSRLYSLKITDLQKMKLEAMFEVSKRIETELLHRDKVSSPLDVYNNLKSEMRHLDKEEFRILILNTKNEIIKTSIISVGSLSASIVHPREVFKEAILHSGASLILAHNHPSGNSQPSREDIQITKRLVEAGSLLGIKIADHVIISTHGYTSFKEEGLI